ncbi:MAG: SprT-like domain-containing protein [Desulfobacterales bacterium]
MSDLKQKDPVKSIKIQVQQDLEHRILHGMACEWDAAWFDLESDKKQLIKRPTFAIKELKGQWGTWSPDKREISLSRQLVLNYPWDSIRDVLLHEMAHQLAQQLWSTSGQMPHGTAFKQACRLLHIDSAASVNYAPLQDRLLRDASNARDKRMLRVKKLLALAESKNRFEAEAAMIKAHELIARHNIELSHHEDKRRFLSIFLGSPALRHPREDYHLANLLQDYYFVSGIWVPTYVIEKQKMGRVLEISGTAQNLKIADYVHNFIVQFIDTQWRKYNQEKGLNRYRKTDFAVGIIEGFRNKLELSVVKKKTKKDIFALIQKGDPQLQKYFRLKYPHTTSVNKTASRQDIRVLNDGKKLGKKLVITKGISERKTAKPRLITGA